MSAYLTYDDCADGDTVMTKKTSSEIHGALLPVPALSQPSNPNSKQIVHIPCEGYETFYHAYLEVRLMLDMVCHGKISHHQAIYNISQHPILS